MRREAISIQILPNEKFEEADIYDIFSLGNAHAITKFTNTRRRIASSLMPVIVGILGSSQPVTYFSATNCK